jgi:hypothetical protein
MPVFDLFLRSLVMLLIFFTGYGADVVRFLECNVSLLYTDLSLQEYQQTGTRGGMKNFWNRATSRSFWGWPTISLGSEPAFLSGSPLRPTRLSFELEEIVVRWPNG